MWTTPDYDYVMCASREAPIPERNSGNSCPVTGNPIHLGAEIKTQIEPDYERGALLFIRTYNSGAGTILSDAYLGKGWQHNFAARVIVSASGTTATVLRGDGRIQSFAFVSGKWVSWSDVNDRLIENKDVAGTRLV